ncbi:MAG: HAD family hydrolase [Chloroflexi bacterium]|nr:HAD family hydrolase [Chloroflexota bacterium]
MRPDALIFDLDGTLADNLPAIFQSFRIAFQRVSGVVYPDAEIFAMFGPTQREIFEAGAPGRWQEALEAYHGAYTAALAEGSFTVPGIADLLDWLSRQGKPLAVVTGADGWQAARTLTTLGLAHYFDLVRCGAPGLAKVDNLGYVLKEWRLAPGRIGYVSDSPRDVELGLRAGIVPLGAAWTRSSDARALWRSGAVHVFDAPSAFLQWLQSAPSDEAPVL